MESCPKCGVPMLDKQKGTFNFTRLSGMSEYAVTCLKCGTHISDEWLNH